MILVTVGTEQFPFNALMNWVDLLIRYGFIDQDEEVVVQYGSSTKIPDQVKVFNRLPESRFKALVEEARVVISHCGEGSALLLESYCKPHVLVPRTQRFGEHVDDHQLEMAEAMEKQGICVARSPGDLVKFLAAPKAAKLNSYNEEELCNILSDRYDPNKYKKVMLVCSSGGHFKYAQSMKPFWEQYEQVSWVTFRTATTESELKSEQGTVYWAYSPTNRNLPNLVRNLVLAFKVVGKEKPDIIVSTGAGVAVPFLLIAKYLYNSKVVFVESKTRLKQLSLSARILEFLWAFDALIVRSKEIAACYPKAEYVAAPSTETSILQKEEAKPTTFFTSNDTALLSTPNCMGILEAPEFHSNFQGLCRKARKKIVLDMSATKSMDSAGLGALVSSLKTANSQNIELVLWSVNPEVMSVLSSTKFDRIFQMETATETVRYPKSPQRKYQPIYPARNIIERAIDIGVATVGLIITAILFLPIALAIKLESPGPILCSHIRCGFMGKHFRIWKFRLTPGGAMEMTSKSDPTYKMTRVGRFLYETKLDKLPVFWNLLIGDISFAGPKPATVHEVNAYSIQEWSRLAVKPGVTPSPLFAKYLRVSYGS